MRLTATAFCVVLLFSLVSGAQDAPSVPPAPAPLPESLPAAPAAAPSEQPAAPAAVPGDPAAPAAVVPAAPPAPTGDQIHLKSGKVLNNLQILRKSPQGFEVQVSGNVTFFIPRKQVLEVKYDDIEPARQRPGAELPEHKQATFFGEKLEPATFDKLNKPLPETCLKSTNRDIVDIVALISAETGVKIEVSDAVKQLPPAERQWDYTVPPGTTLTALLQTNLPERFPDLAIAYRYDTLVITTREDAATQTTEAGTETAPAPANQ